MGVTHRGLGGPELVTLPPAMSSAVSSSQGGHDGWPGEQPARCHHPPGCSRPSALRGPERPLARPPRLSSSCMESPQPGAQDPRSVQFHLPFLECSLFPVIQPHPTPSLPLRGLKFTAAAEAGSRRPRVRVLGHLCVWGEKSHSQLPFISEAETLSRLLSSAQTFHLKKEVQDGKSRHHQSVSAA